MRAIVVAAVVVGCGGGRAPEPVAPPVSNVMAAGVDAAVVDATPAVTSDPVVGVGDKMPAIPPPVCRDPLLRIDEIDLNKDGRPDVTKTFAPSHAGGEYVMCKANDFDLDG